MKDRRQENKPLVPIVLNPKIETTAFSGRHPLMGRANKSGRAGSSWGKLVGLENSKEMLEGRMWAAIFGGVSAIVKAKIEKDAKNKPLQEAIDQLREGLQDQWNQKFGKLEELVKTLTGDTVGQILSDALEGDDEDAQGEAIDIYNAYESGDTELFQSLFEKYYPDISTLEDQPPLIDDHELTPEEIHDEIHRGIRNLDGSINLQQREQDILNTIAQEEAEEADLYNYSLDSFVPTGMETEMPQPTPSSGGFDPEKALKYAEEMVQKNDKDEEEDEDE